MKRKCLFLIPILFVLSACNSNSNKKATDTSNTSSNLSTSTTSSSPATSSVTSSTKATSGTTSESVTSVPDIPPVTGFCFNPSQITIDLKDEDVGYLKCFNTSNPTANIDWVVPHSNILRLEKIVTKSGELNSFKALNVGSVIIQGKVGTETTNCVISVVSTTQKKTSGTETISIYAVNDYHGHVNEEFSLKHYGTFIKQKVSRPNTLFLDQGDTWQGSLESNYNRGRMITDVYNAAGMSARTIGNHDFDWEIEALVNNTNANYCGYSTPVLAANVYDFDWDNKQVGTTQQSNIGQEYVTFTLESGIKVGVIGTISDTCEPDINTPNIMTVEFTPMIQKIQELSDTLRVEESCDIIIASMHEGFYDELGTALSSVSPVSQKKYIDLGLNGHTHQRETFNGPDYNNVTFAQFGRYDNYIGKVNLTFDYATNSVTSTNAYGLSTSSLLSDVQTIDPEIDAIVDHYNEETDEIGSEVLTNQLSGEFDRYEAMPNLVCKAMYEEAIRQGYDVSYALCNMSRTSLEGPTVTYSSLYETLPFDNVCYIVELSGYDAWREMNTSGSLFIYRGDNDDATQPIDKNKEKYTFVVIDYVALHAGVDREYDYIPSVNPIARLLKTGQTYVYRDVAADYLRAQEGVISSSSYSSSNIRFDRSRTNQALS